MNRTTFSDTTESYVEPEEVREERARELYQYFRPGQESKHEAIYLRYPDAVLQAHAQLAACRLNVQRAIIALTDKDTSYVVAESTQTLDLEDMNQSEHPEDGLRFGNVSMPKAGGLVEWTILQDPQEVDGNEVPAHFEILDMYTDPRWEHSMFAIPTHFRFYCGVPLRTDNGISIGALFVLDSRPHDSTSLPHLKVLSTLARNIMIHMQAVKDTHEKQRAFRMNKCMADFINPEHRHRSRPPDPKISSSFTTTEALTTPAWSRQSSYASECSQASPLPTPNVVSAPDEVGLLHAPQAEDQKTERIDRLLSAKSSSIDERRGRPAYQEPQSGTRSPSPTRKEFTEAEHQKTFDRAAYLLRQALDLSHSCGGGVVLFDANALVDTDLEMQRRGSNNSQGSRRSGLSRENSFVTGTKTASQSSAAYTGTVRDRVVLAAASLDQNPSCAPKNYGRADPSYAVTLTPPELGRLCKKHPRGKLYNIPDNVGQSLFDWEGRPVTGRLSSQLYELVLLHRQFPQAKQVIFIPMFHANLNRWTSCFAYTNSHYRVLSYEMDLLPTLAFCNALRAEIVQSAAVSADKQKGDLIGSVSHELRSPLHGILASVEFLQDTDCDAFQKSCVNTMDSCAQTLLDTIAMVLDYNKVNRLREAASRSSSTNSDLVQPKMSTTTSLRNEPLFVTDQDCDVALITEEVIDGLATGHLARHRTNTAFDDFDPDYNNSLSDLASLLGLRRVLDVVRPQVELVVDIQPAPDWMYTTQPGAIRRIVMNLFGNSLKYTRHGYITVSLRVSGSHSQQGDQSVKFAEDKPTIVKLTVTDTGQGMSPDYLRTKVFTPFAQENAKSAGTGLGLSIVRSIVNLMHGEIDIKSIVNVGTRITVTLPLKKARVVNSPSNRTASPTRRFPAPRPKDGSIIALQNLQSTPQAAIYEPAMELDSFGQTQGAAAVHAALVQYLTGWFKFAALKTWNFDLPAKILILDEIHLPTLLARRPDYLETLSRQSIIILCANPSRQSILTKDITSSHVEVICKPFGPNKLARALCSALEKAAKASTVSQHIDIIQSRASTATATSSNSKYQPSSIQSAGSSTTTRRRGSIEGTCFRDAHTSLAFSHSKEISINSEGGFPFHGN